MEGQSKESFDSSLSAKQKSQKTDGELFKIEKKLKPNEKEAELKNMIKGATLIPDTQRDLMEPLDALEKRCRDEGFDLTDPGYIEYYNAVKEYLENRCTNTYGDCEVSFLYKDDLQPNTREPKTQMIFVKPDQTVGSVAKACYVKLQPNAIGKLIDGNVKDTMKDTLTQEQIDDGYVVIDGVKPRSKYIKIEITNHKLSLGV